MRSMIRVAMSGAWPDGFAMLEGTMDDLENPFVSFQYAIANALMQWQLIEHRVFQLFMESIDCRSKTYVAAAYHAAIHFDTKVRMTDEILRLRLAEDPLLEEWTTLRNRLRKRIKSRNKLVHWFHESEPVAKRGEISHIWRLAPNFLDPRPSEQPLSKAEIEGIRSLFSQLGGDLGVFVSKVKTFLASPEKSP